MGNASTVPLNEEVTMGWSSLVSLTEDWVAVDLLQFSYQTRFAITKVTARLLLGVEGSPVSRNLGWRRNLACRPRSAPVDHQELSGARGLRSSTCPT